MELEMNDIESVLEGILFASGEPVPAERIAATLGVHKTDVYQAAHALAHRLQTERRGIRLVVLGDALQLCSAPEHADVIRRALEARKQPQLSPQALEVLAIVAYHQPVTKLFVDQIRGVDSSYTVGLLVDRGLIETCGRLNVPGRPLLYRTTPAFLRTFGIASLDELPPLPETDSGEETPPDDWVQIKMETPS
jgi:segregation and condensation protein B